MEVVLLKEVDGIREAGERKNVKDGFALNYLFPNRLALRVTKGNLTRVKEMEKVREERLLKLKEDCLCLAEKISKVSCTLARQAGEDEKLFGSVTNSDIAEALSENGIEVDKKKILLKEPIKKVGVYNVDIKLHSEVTARAKIWVVKQ